MVQVFFSSQSLTENSHIANSMMSGIQLEQTALFGNFAGPKINAFASAVNYCRRMLLMAALEKAGIPLTIDADWERQLDILYRTDKISRKSMKDHVKTVDQDSILTYLSAAFEGMLLKDGNGLGDCGKCFVEIGSISSSAVIGQLSRRADELLPSVRSNNIATRFLAAQAFGFLASHHKTSSESIRTKIISLISEMKPWEGAVGADANRVHG